MEEQVRTCAQTRAIHSHRIFPFDVNMHDTLFGGNLTRMIDDCASITVSRHCRRLAVTASVDAMNYIKPLPMGHSVCVETYISGVGKKSMEVFCKVVGEDVLSGERYLAATSFWTFVALPREGETDFSVPKIQPETEEEQLICNGYDERRQARLEQLQRQEALMEKITVDKPWTAAK